MHILIIPSEHYVTQRFPLGAIFQYHQAQTLRETGIKTGVISAGFIPFGMMIMPYHYLPFENDNGVNTYKYYRRMFIPGRIAYGFFSMYLVRLYLLLFEKYIRVQGMPDIVHAHNCLYAGVVAAKIKRKFGIPFVITEHSSAYARGLISRRQSCLTQEVLKNADAKTVVSTKLGRLLENLFGADACPNYVIFNILDGRFEYDGDIAGNCNVETSLFIFLSMGSLDNIKNHSHLIAAFASKFKKKSFVKLKIVGSGPLRKNLEKQVKELDVEEQVIFTGLLDRESVFEEMQKCNVFVLPSKYETFGVVLVEALARGKPVIATKCGGPEDIVKNDNGILVSTDEVNELAEAMWNIYMNIEKYDAKIIREDCLSRFGKKAFLKRLKMIYSLILGDVYLSGRE